MQPKWLLTAALLPLFALPASAADSVKIGLITTLSGPEAVMGNPMRDSANLALSMLGGKVGGLPAEIVFGDDQQKPDLGRQQAEKMLKKDKVDFITGMLGSNVLLAVYQQVVSSHTILISANSGPHQLAARRCAHRTSSPWRRRMTIAPEAMGHYMAEHHVDGVYVMAPNYAAGHDMISGFKRTYQGKIVGEVYTTFGQFDYQAELSEIRAAKPKAVFVFYPGGMGIQFVKQYAESGLKRKSRSTRSTPSIRARCRRSAKQHSATTTRASGAPISLFLAAGNTPRPSQAIRLYAAQLRRRHLRRHFAIDSAVKAVHGDLADKPGLITALEQANFPSVRGSSRSTPIIFRSRISISFRCRMPWTARKC